VGLYLDVFYDDGVDEAFARRAADDLVAEVRRLAPHVALNVEVLPATAVGPWHGHLASGRGFKAFYHEPSVPDRQSLLITDSDIGDFEGLGTIGYAVVSMPRMIEKERSGGYPVDIVIHEWLHTIEAVSIDGHPVPCVDHAQRYGYAAEQDSAGQWRWPTWYRRCLGTRDPA
jgi:hypothetical protein